ncbi:hypothetical protein FBU59_002727 [Linderina macrospora]|uniref:Uncharacterized protein n=1 Tax=Linderina macrospora TaxID=4868 RepID=A0ACC1JAI3_9FUNG|nr:hypothetical protein FBU59_002727 [Linderina macrospora]
MVASIRRSFYPETVRINFVKRMSAGIVEVLQSGIGLDDIDNYHHMCRLLARFRCIHTLVEIEETPIYRELIVSAAGFTSTALTLWEWSPNSFAPLLTFWAKIATTHDSRDNNKASIAGDVISDALPKIVKLYLDSMLLVTSRVVTGESAADNPLEDNDGLVENITLLTNIVRSSYLTCAPVIISMFREMAGEYQNLLSSGQITEEALVTMESQLAWPTYAMALCINGRQPYKSLAEDDAIDADMFAIGMELDRLVQQRLTSPISVPPCEALELGFLQLYYSFRASYIGEQGYKTTSIFAKLSEVAGITDSAAVLELTMQKVMFNLKTWRTQTAVISRSLQLLHDMSIGYVSVRQITKLNTIKLLLANHNSDQFYFLSYIDEYKQRALYYSALARILMATESSTTTTFAEFAQPWSTMIDGMLSLPDSQFAQPNMRLSLIRILRDMRGFLSALSSRAGYTMFFNWIWPSRIQLVHRCLSLSKDPLIHVAALKFMSEFVFNRTQRLNFDISSPNGILIFREASKAMWEYGSHILKSTEPVRDIYKDRYKGVSVCFTILTRLFVGKYVAVGVMPLYGDDTLDKALKITVEMLKQFPISDVIAYPKLGKATLTMLETLLARTNLELVDLDNTAYEQIMRICVEAFDHAEVAVSSSACTVINSVVTNAIEGVEDGIARAEDLAELVHGRVDINQYLLKALLNIVLFEDRSNDWSFSRPLFCLMVLQFSFAMQYTEQIVQYQPAERRDDLVAALKALFSAAEFQLKSANRDAFTQALTQYRREVNTKNLIMMVPTDQTLGAPVQILGGSSDGEDASAMAD